MKKINTLSALLLTTLFSINLLNAANDSTTVILEGVNLENPVINQVKDSYSLIFNAIKNDNFENAITLLDSTKIQDSLTDQDVSKISDLKEQAQVDSANKLKRENLRNLLILGVKRCFPENILSKLTTLMVKNKSINTSTRAEIYSDATTLFAAAINVLENVNNQYQDLCSLDDLDLASEFKQNLRISHNDTIIRYLKILKILVNTLVENQYEQICHGYLDYNKTIWKLYKKARELCTICYAWQSSAQASPEHFKNFLENHVEPVYKWNKRCLIFADTASQIAAATLGVLTIVGIGTSILLATENFRA